MTQTNQEALHQAVRNVTGTSLTYNGDWMALFDAYGIADADFNGRMIAWLQTVTGSTLDNINDLKQLYASLLGYYNWNSIRGLTVISAKALYDASRTPTGAVATWGDFSGNGNHAPQGSGSAQPTCTANQINGKNALVLDGGDTLQLPNGLFGIPNGANTTFVVAKRSTETGSQEFMVRMSEATSFRWGLRYAATAGRVSFWNSNAAPGTEVESSGHTNTNYNIICGRRSGTTLGISVNGVAEVTNANGNSESGVDAGYIGSAVGASSFLTGGIAEIAIYPFSLSVAQISLMKSHYSAKWGISL